MYGNGDYNAWGPQESRQQQHYYDDYYRHSRDGMYGDDRGMRLIEQGMGGLGMREEVVGGRKSTTWATIASQPAKPQSIGKKSKPGMPLPPVIPGAWDTRNGISKAPIAAPVQAPAWERPKVPPPVQPPPVQAPPPVNHRDRDVPPHHMQPPPGRGYQCFPPSNGREHGAVGSGGGYQNPAHSMGYIPSQHQQHQPPPVTIQHRPNNAHAQYPPTHHDGNGYQRNGNHAPPPAIAPAPAAPKYPDESKMKDYNPATFDLMAEGARFFVIKSYSEDDIHRSIKYEIWCSTEHGNKRLDEAYKEREENRGVIYLLFSVNGSGHFCGMAQMISRVDYHAKSSVWAQDKWKGQFKVKWIYVKDVPNGHLRHIRLENNENKPVTNSRDTQEVPFEKGKQVLKILHTYQHTTSIFDDFIHYEKRQEEEDQRKVVVQPPPPPMHNARGGGRGGYSDRGGFRGGNHHGFPPRDFESRGEYNPREFRDRGSDNHGGRDGAFMNSRQDPRDRGFDHRGERPGPDSFSRDDRELSRDRPDRDFRGGHRGGGRPGPPMMRNFDKPNKHFDDY